MNDISWNFHGLGNPETVRELHNLVSLEAPTLVFLCETKIEGKRVSDLMTRLGFERCRAVNSAGLSGGLALFWSREVEVKVESISDQHIDATVKNVGSDNKVWRFTGFYAKAKRSERSSSCDLLRWHKVYYHGYAVVILMKFYEVPSTLDRMIAQSGKWKVSVMLWIFVLSRTSGSREPHLLVIICERGKLT